MTRRLKTIASWINNNMPGYVAKIEASEYNTDRKCGRLRIPGKGRHGSRLIVTKNSKVVLDHNSAETYRNNSEVERWIERELQTIKNLPE